MWRRREDTEQELYKDVIGACEGGQGMMLWMEPGISNCTCTSM